VNFEEAWASLRPFEGPSAQGVDRSTLYGKVVAGYQGWFNAPGDGAGMGWNSWARMGDFKPGNCTIDAWPDLSEFDEDEKYPTEFRHADGRAASVFSAFNRKTVLRHFRWMRDYGIDGAFVQRFIAPLSDPVRLNHANTVLSHCREGANASGRSYCVMYDLSGMDSSGVVAVKADWKALADRAGISRRGADGAYQYHRGKPLLVLWGIGFCDGRKYGLEDCMELLRFFKDDPTYGGCSVMLGVPTGWRLQPFRHRYVPRVKERSLVMDGDCVQDPLLHQLVASADIISPWTVDRIDSFEGAEAIAAIWLEDMRYCQGFGVDFMPVVFPGFSWGNLFEGEPHDQIPRRGGRFLWKQYYEAIKAGAPMIYQAMFDEVNEGTAIFKCTSDPPVGVSRFLDMDGAESDLFLRLAGRAGKALRGEVPLTEAMPSLQPAYKDRSLGDEARIADLLSRMSPREKARQLDQYFGASLVVASHPRMPTVMAEGAGVDWDAVRSTIGLEGLGCIHDLYGTAEVNNALQRYAIEETRLGIPILFAEEILHGLLRPGCSVFPQAIALASTWDPALVEGVGRAIAAEAASFGIREGFGPVLDLAREPRWGRVEETYGEDTHLASRMAAAMVRGLQGDQLRSGSGIAAEPKHFAAHGIPEGGLNTSHSSLGFHELREHYLPVFEAAFVEAGALNAMCSYNAIDGQPYASSRFLLTEILRGEWGMRGLVRSDLGAIARLHRDHKTAKSPKEAIAQALLAGVDMQFYDFPHELFESAILESLEDSSIAMRDLDRAAGRVLGVKLALGLFERPYAEPDASARVVRSEAHGELALEAARKAVCLLKNDGAFLPLAKSVASIAVIGPGAAQAMLGDYTPHIEGFVPVSLLEGLRRLASPGTSIRCAKGSLFAEDELEALPAEFLWDGRGGSGLWAEYFNDPGLSGEPALERTDPRIDFNWAIAKPDEKLAAKDFSVRWTGKLRLPSAFSGKIGLAGQDAMRLWLDGELVVDRWDEARRGPASIACELQAGRGYALRIEYRKDRSGAGFLLGWNDDSASIAQAVALARESEVAILALGDSPTTCGEGLDRSSLDLPGRQGELLRAVCATGTPIVLVLQGGRPLALGREAALALAIIEAWYCGEKGGLAIAEAIFGDINPAGRLPVSFPKTVGQLPVYYNRKRGGQSRYTDGDNEPLFAFGHGLSYTSFRYESLRLDSGELVPGERMGFEVVVRNVGDRAGDEVVQVYLRDLYSSVVRPDRELKDFRRVRLESGAAATLTFSLGPRDLSYPGADGAWIAESGDFEILVGSSSDSIELSATFRLL
jgi:beta-glucosidase